MLSSQLKYRQKHHLVIENGTETENFAKLSQIVAENPGCTEGLVNNKFTPFPKKYKNKLFEVVLSVGSVVQATIGNSKSGLKWLDKKGQNITPKVMAWQVIS